MIMTVKGNASFASELLNIRVAFSLCVTLSRVLMADFLMFRGFVGVMAEAIVRGGTAPSSTGYHLILCNTGAGGGVITPSMAIATVVGFELPNANSYARVNYAPGAGSFDATDVRYEFPSVGCAFAASAELTFNAWALLADSNTTIGSTTGTPALFYNYPSPQVAQEFTIPINWNFACGPANFIGVES